MFPRILTNENVWNWEFGVRVRFLLDEGFDWTAIFVQLDAFRWHTYWGAARYRLARNSYTFPLTRPLAISIV